MTRIDTVFDYEDIELVPAKCIVNSRSECDTSVQFGPRTFKLPIVPANMETVIDTKLAKFLAHHGYFYVMHRFDPEHRIEFVKELQAEGMFASISVGVKESEYQLIRDLKAQNLCPEYITIDIAHGHAVSVIDMIKFVKKELPNTYLIAGNVGTPEGVRELENAGADSVKVGIGSGKVCITKLKTGFGTGGWQLAALRSCAKVATKPLIADGGIRNHGDIAKSIRFGAGMVMIGSMFAGHEQSPGKRIEVDDQVYKEYFGSASEYQKGEKTHVEGKKLLIAYKGDIMHTLTEMRQDLQSAISYAGGNKLMALKTVDYVVVKNSIFNGDMI